jgi:hypothetical protein
MSKNIFTVVFLIFFLCGCISPPSLPSWVDAYDYGDIEISDEIIESGQINDMEEDPAKDAVQDFGPDDFAEDIAGEISEDAAQDFSPDDFAEDTPEDIAILDIFELDINICVCGDGNCDEETCGENVTSCPADCHLCGNGKCEPTEGPDKCPQDCCGYCGDKKCASYGKCTETKDTCAEDCAPAGCGNSVCEKGENPANCSNDCQKFICGNNICEPGEDMNGENPCKDDCGDNCGNCLCQGEEDYINCPIDCGYCGDGYCSPCAGLNETKTSCLKDCCIKSPEVCNGKDDDCNEVIDDPGAEGCVDFYFDFDGDGFGAAQKMCLCKPDGFFKAVKGGDCDDTKKDVNPDAKETCTTTYDDDCDTDANDIDAIGCTKRYYDADTDSYGTSAFECRCSVQGLYSALVPGDCNDNQKEINPSADETCLTDYDDNCNITDDNSLNLAGCIKRYYDEDEDGYYAAGAFSECRCKPEGKYTALTKGDCDDTNKDINPGSAETCLTDYDDDCYPANDNALDLPQCTKRYYDNDGDGYYASGALSECRCKPEGKYTALMQGDCNDSNPLVYPDCAEKECGDDGCGGICGTCATGFECKDYKCTELPEQEPETAEQPDIIEPAPEIIEDVYEAVIAEDAAQDISPDSIAEEISEDAPEDFIPPLDLSLDIPEICTPNCLNKDCGDNGCFGSCGTCDSCHMCNTSGKCVAKDADGDGYADKDCGGDDCDDTNKEINPGAAEVCDGIDNDCKYGIDDSAACQAITYYCDEDKDTYRSKTATNTCNTFNCVPAGCDSNPGTDCNDSDKFVNPDAAEECNGIDDNCANGIDEGDVCPIITYYCDGDKDNFYSETISGICSTYNCKPAECDLNPGMDCDDAVSATNPEAVEICDGLDNNCDGKTDDLWNTSSIDQAGDVGETNSIRLDSNGKVHIAYNDYTGKDLKYATNAWGAWTVVTLDTYYSSGTYCSIALDSRNKVHISHRNSYDINLRYASNKSGSWIYTVVDTNGNVGQYSDIAVDPFDYVHISYYDISNSDLRYATNKTGSWQFQKVDTGGDVGSYSSIVVDGNGNPYIAYYDTTNKDLKLARNLSGSWEFFRIDSLNDVGVWASLAMDKNSGLHISYCDYTNRDLRYATNKSGSWAVYTLETLNNTGYYTSIAADQNGAVHISYYYQTAKDLKYVTNTGGSWTFRAIDTAGDVGNYSTSIAVDGKGRVHISYYDYSYGDLKYASFGCGGMCAGEDKDGDDRKDILCGGPDCNDDDPEIYPERKENCSTWYDDNCDGDTNDENGTGCLDFYQDQDGDMYYPDGAQSKCFCIPSGQYTGTISGDCADADAKVFPGAEEICDGKDNNCDGEPGEWVDEGCDDDKDGWCDINMVYQAPVPKCPNGGGDCDDGNIDVYPGQTEICDNIDNNCAGNPAIDEGCDDDFDGWCDKDMIIEGSPTICPNGINDCDDSDNAEYPGNPEICDGKDNDCNGKTDDVWKIYTVDSAGLKGNYNSIAYDPNNKVHISYYDKTNLDLRYATNSSGSWMFISLDTKGDVGIFPAVKIDFRGAAHISYRDDTNLDLKYVTNVTGSWVFSKVETAVSCWMSSLAIDSEYRIHISYRDTTNFNLKYATNATGTWQRVGIDATGDIGGFNSIGMDGSDHVHIGYSDETKKELKYATNLNGTWQKMTVDSSGDVGTYLSLGIDSGNKVHISYRDTANTNLKYATNTSGTWQYFTIDSAGDVGTYSSLAIDANDRIHISYIDAGNLDLKYATNASGTWVLIVVDSSGINRFTSIGVDPGGKIAISYHDDTNGDLKLATFGCGAVCSKQDKDGDGVKDVLCGGTDCNDDDKDVFPAQVEKCATSYDDNCNSNANDDGAEGCTTKYYDGDGDGYYVDGAASECLCVHNPKFTADPANSGDCNDSNAPEHPGGTETCDNMDNDCNGNTDDVWYFYTLDSYDWTGQYASIEVDSNNKVHISYFEDKNDDLKYATNSSGTWIYTIVDYVGVVGTHSSIAIDSNNRVHISYLDSTNNDLKYSTNAGGSWISIPLDSAGNVGKYSSIAVDSNNKAHISYFDDINDDLKYTTNSEGTWIYTTLDSIGDVGEFTSIAIDSGNWVHISYLDHTNDQLKYATNSSGFWSYFTLDLYDGFDTSIDIDTNDKIHISYGLDLNYATNSSGVWTHEKIIDSFYALAYTSIAVDSKFKAHISFWDDSYDDLKYATNSSGNWNYMTLDSVGDVGDYSSIAVDSRDKLYIAYYKHVNSDLKLATFGCGTVCTVPDKDGDGVTDILCGGTDCNDDNPEIYPERKEDCGTWYDDNCNNDTNDKGATGCYPKYYDGDGDGWYDVGNGYECHCTPVGKYTADPANSGDCDDDDPDVNPGKAEICDGKDNNCANGIDEGNICPVIDYYCDTDGDGYVSDTISGSCSIYNCMPLGCSTDPGTDCDDAHTEVKPDGTEVCDNLDNDCSGKTDDVWSVYRLDSALNVGWYSSLGLDSNNRIHISYYDSTNTALKYATNASGTWIYFMLDSADDAGMYTSIAVDSNNRIHISYQNYTETNLKYASNASGTWILLTIDSAGDTGHFTSIAVDSLDNMHIAYYNATDKDLKYAANKTGSWIIETVDSPDNVGSYPSIALDSNNKVHISYNDYTNGDLRYATNASGSWISFRIDSEGYVGLITSLVLDAGNKVHISHLDYNQYNLKYTTNSTGSWVSVTLDSSGDTGSYPSIDLDSDGKVLISYRDLSNSNLKYATNASGTWLYITLDSEGDVGTHTSLEIDSNNRIYISYYDEANSDLKLATFGCGTVCTAQDKDGDGYNDKLCGGTDCNDDDKDVFPAQVEKCATSYDDNCNGNNNDKDAVDCKNYYYDNDGDGYGVTLNYECRCKPEGKYSTLNSGDCDDGKASVNPGVANEICATPDDDNCDGSSNDLNAIGCSSYYWDGDGDGYYAAGAPFECRCTPSGYYQAYPGPSQDCDDAHPEAKPGGIEVCDNLDNDCNGKTDELWNNYLIDTAGNVGEMHSIAVDLNNKVHVTYNDDTNTDLKYAANASGSWVIIQLDTNGTVGGQSSIAIDKNNRLHISYAGNSYLMYRTNRSGSWVVEYADPAGNYPGPTSIAVDGNGRAHISYVVNTGGKIMYATNASGSWQSIIIDSDGWDSSIAVDSGNNVHIAYKQDVTIDVRYATNASGSWTNILLDSQGDVGYFCNMTVDGNGRVHVVYLDDIPANLKYTTNSSGSWVTATLDSIGNVGYSPSVRVDSSNNVYIAYKDDSNKQIKYAVKTAGSWTFASIDPGIVNFSNTSLALDSLNRPHIAYWDSGNQDIRLATFGCTTVCTATDKDGDGYNDKLCGGDDCNDNSANAHPGLFEICNDNLDNDCDGTVDANGSICGTDLWCHNGTCGGEWGDNGNGTIMNYKYNLMWQQTDTYMPWSNAITYCNGLDSAGFNDWRLPTIDELRSLIIGCPATMPGGACPATNSCGCGFTTDCGGCAQWGGPGTGGCYYPSMFQGSCLEYWSSSTYPPNEANAWKVNFDHALVSSHGKDNNDYARCVRSGK